MTKETPHFHQAYYSARKAYALFSGLSLLYSLVGLRIGTKPFSSIDIELLAPSAIPVILILLVIYYGFRYIIEWRQTNYDRREFTISKLDFALSHTLALLTIAVFIYQQLSDSLVFDSDSAIKTFIFSIIKITIIEIVFMSVVITDSYFKFLKKISQDILILFISIILYASSIACYYIYGESFDLQLASYIGLEVFLNLIVIFFFKSFIRVYHRS